MSATLPNPAMATGRLLSWPDYLARRARTRALAEGALHRLEGGDAGVAQALLGPWRCADAPTLLSALLDRLEEPLHPSGASFAAVMSVQAARLPPPRRDPVRAGHVWREWLETQLSPEEPASAREAKIWALCELARLGEERDQLERRAWRGRYKADPERDRDAAWLWEGWFARDYGRVFYTWGRRFAASAGAALSAVLRARQLPDELRRYHLRTFREAFEILCFGNTGEPEPWREIAARVVEGGPAGPVAALVPGLEAPSWRKVLGCVASRRAWAHTLGRPGLLELSEPSSPADLPTPSAVEQAVDLHLALRLLSSWSTPERSGARRSLQGLRQGLVRARGRLRALLRDQEGERLRAALLGMDALYSRTDSAVRSYFHSWAWRALHGSLAIQPYVVTRTCVFTGRPPPPSRPPLEPGAREAMARTWVLLVLLRGERDALHRWAREGGETDGSFARLLLSAPEPLTGNRVGKNKDYRPLRARLSEGLSAVEADLLPVLGRVGALCEAPARGLKGRFYEALAPDWSEALPLPERGFPSMIATARALCAPQSGRSA